MKKTILTIIAAISVATLFAQTVNVHFKNGQKVQFSSLNVDYVDFSPKAPDPTVSSGQVVDLGLSVYWASCNVGAELPEEEGNRYAWGETKTKSQYNSGNYSYYDSDKWQYIDIGSIISGTEYDAATINLGTDWKMPTKVQMEELLNNCSWEWTQINGVNGYKVTGSNGNSIFLASGASSVTGMRYWIGSDADILYVTPTGKYIASQKEYRYEGCYIRPVTSNINAGGTPIDHSNDYLVTDKVTASFLGGSFSTFNGKIQGGSQLNVKFSNGSSETVVLTKAQLIDGATGTEGNNLLDVEVDVAAGESKSYTVTVGYAGITTPVIRFTYVYNKKKYTAEATWNSSF